MVQRKCWRVQLRHCKERQYAFFQSIYQEDEVVLPGVGSRTGSIARRVEIPRSRLESRATYSTAIRARSSNAAHKCTERVSINICGDSRHILCKCERCFVA